MALLISFLMVLILFFIYGIHRYILDKRYHIPPGPPPLPFLGNILNLTVSKTIWKAFWSISENYGPIVTLYLGQIRMIVLNSSDAVQEAIVAKSKVFSNRPIDFMPGFKDMPTGVLFSNGPLWQQRRRFSLRALRDFGMGKMAIVDKIHDEANYFLQEIEERTFRPFYPNRLVTNTVSNVICSLVFGKRFEYDDKEFKIFIDKLNTLASRQFSRRPLLLIFPFLQNLFSSDQAASYLDLLEDVSRLLKEAIADHREDFNPEHIRDFPDLFIQAELTKDAMDFQGFGLTMVDLFAAGTETTATALNWTLLYLSTYPDIQRKCHDAIDQAIETDRLPDLNDRPNLVYVDAVMCEVFRYATIVPLALFHSNLHTESDISGYGIPPNTIIAYNVWALHHDPTYWSEPDRFDPDRWIDPETGKLLTHLSNFMPFGVGPRVCLGELLAKVEFFIFLVALLQRFTFAMADAKIKLDDGVPGITYSPPKYKLIASKR